MSRHHWVMIGRLGKSGPSARMDRAGSQAPALVARFRCTTSSLSRWRLRRTGVLRRDLAASGIQ